jgi:membrane associated rhomboid family serine protease
MLTCQLTYRGGGFTQDSNVISHLLYSFVHVNLWHLACNLMVLWMIRNKMAVPPAFAIAVIASYLPMYVGSPTAGMSGMLFAMFGVMWGKTNKRKAALRAGLPTIIITMLIPGVNGLLHLYCYLLGIAWGTLRQ